MGEGPGNAEEPASPDEERRRRTEDFKEKVRRKEQRKLRSRGQTRDSIWFGLGMFGLVGWAVAVPTLIGLGTGVWLDRTWPGGRSWTLVGLLAGIVLGCFNAWQWIWKERRQIEHDRDEQEDHVD